MVTTSFHPPLRTLMGPGPSDVHPRVLAASARPTIGHLDPEFVRMMDEVKGLLQYVLQTKNEATVPISAPGSAGMECCFVNLVEPGDTVVVAINGVFGGRMKENIERCGGKAVVVEDAWGSPVDVNKFDDALRAHPEARIAAFVHAETSTGARSDVEALVKIAHAHDCLAIVDAVTSLGGIELRVDAWGIDAIYSGTQKCLSGMPGIAPVSFSDRAVAKIRNRKTEVQSWFLDLTLLMGYWGPGGGKRAYHHTAPINALYALHEALVMVEEEGVEKAWARHRRNHEALRAGFEAMGLEFVVAEPYRLPQLNAVSVPDGIDEAVVRKMLLDDFNLEIGAGLGAMAGKIWRVGLMGQSSTPTHVYRCLGAMEAVLIELGAAIRPGEALAAARAAYAGATATA